MGSLWKGGAIERRGKPLVALVDMADFEIDKREAPAARHPQGALVLIGAWGDVGSDEVDSLIDEIYAKRQQDTGRCVALEPSAGEREGLAPPTRER